MINYSLVKVKVKLATAIIVYLGYIGAFDLIKQKIMIANLLTVVLL